MNRPRRESETGADVRFRLAGTDKGRAPRVQRRLATTGKVTTTKAVEATRWIAAAANLK
jgi:hypothetical protein